MSMMMQRMSSAGTGISSRSPSAVSPRSGRGRAVTVRVEARKVALLGAGGGIGQPLSLLLKVGAAPQLGCTHAHTYTHKCVRVA